ncbi:MAG: hypothetical protein H7X80_04755 [bacterium]|nr:hypothetical protein [Candidatus Kapabacteria bacterium]
MSKLSKLLTRWMMPIAIAITVSIITTGCDDDVVAPENNDIVDGVYTPDSRPYGKTYAEWSAEWWTWAWQTEATNASGDRTHPLFDTTGAHAFNGQQTSGSVLFLAGFLGPGTYTRNVWIPSGKALFFPVVNAYADTTGGWTIDSMRNALDRFATTVNEVFVEVDGRAIANPKSYHFRSSEFAITLPHRNLYEFFGAPYGAGTRIPVMSDGYWIMLAPLSRGVHTIHFRGSMTRPNEPFVLDMTYNVTVV